ncbi:MAG: hypothetical protein F4Z13_03900 [Candidatus Dadabacteria bacterium]|nr:hypothetical protein [Candidatus Dadabacteria bacterium]MYI73042.1 hypothetical protein [Candidatus Dadabacteria bacterium]
MKRFKNLREKIRSFFLSASAPSPRLPRRSTGAGVKNIPESERGTQKAGRDAIDDIRAAGKSSGHSEIKAHRADSGNPRPRTAGGSNGTRIAKVGKYAGLGTVLVLIAWLLPLPPSSGQEVSRDDPVCTDDRAPSLSGTGALVERLRNTNLLNGNEVYDHLDLGSGDTETGASPSRGAGGFLTSSPFEPRYRESYSGIAGLRYPLPPDTRSYEIDETRATFLFYGQEPVLRWHSSLGSNTEVCAVQFVDPDRVDYRLRTFPDQESALSQGHVVTHRYHCGTCSSLRDLAVYLAKPDLTKPARTCGRKLTADGIKKCLMEKVGFAEPCAETWTYNVLHTRRWCMKTCVEHYGLWNMLTNDMDDAHADERGNLNSCLACDEHASGPGFQYAAGRTRRNSGIPSAICRQAGEIYPVEHTLYFE